MKALIITTINGLTEAVKLFIERAEIDMTYIIGDKGGKEPIIYHPKIKFFDYQTQGHTRRISECSHAC